MSTCRICGKPSNGKYRCKECAKKKNNNAKLLRKLRDSQGLCTECGGLRDEPAYKICSQCRKKLKLKKKKLNEKRRRLNEANKKVSTDSLIVLFKDTAKILNITIPNQYFRMLKIKLELEGVEILKFSEENYPL